MDATTGQLADYSCRLSYDELSAGAVHQVKRTLIDTLGCAIAAFDGEPAEIARRLASRALGSPPARILGTRHIHFRIGAGKPLFRAFFRFLRALAIHVLATFRCFGQDCYFVGQHLGKAPGHAQVMRLAPVAIADLPDRKL